MNVRFVGIITKHNVPRVKQVGGDLASWFKKHAIKSVLDLIDPEMDLLVILGGDGTLLHVADQASYHNIPVVGINLGNLGFLTEVAADEMYTALETILDGKGQTEQRMMLKARIVSGTDGKNSRPLFSLNE
ncbi:MAG: NAD(+)/NADH kinase, partial [Desulfobulbaceae bacterium]|nr:NAD(+)/NADH kinase [Desulfobulbaceae bacterium]